MHQDEALSLLKMGKNVFLTGAAGSGKTYVLNKFIIYLKDHQVRVAITASTGIAATHLQGTTLHSWSGIGVRDEINPKYLEKLITNSRIKSNYKKTKVLIIDEISMLHKHQLDMVDTIARFICDSEKPFGGIQVVVCGDFFQLPPVSSNANIKKSFAYEATAWLQGEFHVCYLTEQHRQDDDLLLKVLNDIRNGTAGEHTKVPLRTRYKKEPHGSTKPTKLYSRNINVDVINENELKNIPGKEKTFTMLSEGFGALVETLKKSCLAPEILKLKVGAEVMFVKNDAAGRYVNGTRCIVIDFDKLYGYPTVKTYNNEIIVVTPEEWKYEENGIVRAIITQIPLRLAWAITIHKSQGMTLDAAEIDLGDAFEPGMGYVALSRVRSLDGLKLMNLNEMALKVHPKILAHDKVFKDNSLGSSKYLKTFSKKAISECHNKILVERYSVSGIKQIIQDKKEKKRKEKTPTHMTTWQMLNDNLSIEAIASKRKLSVSTIINHVEKLKGLKKLDTALLAMLKATIAETDFDVILAELEKSADGKVMAIYDKFAGKYSYDSIKLVRIFV